MRLRKSVFLSELAIDGKTFAGPFRPGSTSSAAHEFYVSMFRNTIDYGIPASISVLINFGLDDKHIQYSADNLEHGCTIKQVNIDGSAARGPNSFKFRKVFRKSFRVHFLRKTPVQTAILETFV